MKNTQLYRKIVVLVAVALLSGGAIVYADFIRTTGSSGFGYGYGYDTDSGTYGYGYGYLQSDTSPTNRELYGFPGTDGAATGVSAGSLACTTATISYTSDYLAKHNVTYTATSTTTTSWTDFETGAQSIDLTGLSPETTYTFIVGSQDASGASWPAASDTFETPACPSTSPGGGGGGGGGGYVPPVIPPVQPPVTPPTVTLGSVCSAIARNLTVGMKGQDVKDLQNFLNSKGYNVGKADGSFGPRTRSGLAKFQSANRISPAVGFFGPKTRAVVNLKCVSVLSSVPPLTKFIFSSPLKIGSRGNEVKELQNLLNSLGYDVGKADGVFGSKTKNALAKLQVANGPDGDGVVGPKTRAVLNK